MALISAVVLSLTVSAANAGSIFRPLIGGPAERQQHRPIGRAAEAATAKPLRLVIMGPPGSGKGTQSARIEIDFGVRHISSGDILREHAKTDPEVASIIARGELVPFPLVMRLMKRRLSEEDVRKNGFILDGFPRRLEDAIALLEILTDLGMPLDAVIRLDAPEDVLRRRVLGRGRADDNELVFRDRLSVYREQTEPVYAFLTDKVRFLTPDVSGDDPDAAYENVRRALASLPKR